MSIYSEYTAISSAQNSYYSVASVVAKVSEYIPQESSLNELEELLKSYYIPAFTVDIDDNNLYISVYPLDGAVSYIQVPRVVNSVPVVLQSQPEISDTNVGFTERIQPAEIAPVKVDPSIHGDPVIKRPVAKIEMEQEDYTNHFYSVFGWQPIENLFITRFPQDENDNSKVVEMKAGLGVMQDIIANQLNDLDPEAYQHIIDEYNSWLQKIQAVQEFLQLLTDQQESLKAIIDIPSIKNTFFNTNVQGKWGNYENTPLSFMDADGVEQVINQLAQGMSQVFGEYNNGDASIPFFRPPLWDSKISQTQLIGGLAWQQLIPGASDPLTTLAYYYPITITGEIVPADATGIHVNNWDGTESGDLSFHRIDSGLSDLTSPFPHVLQEIGLYNSPESLNSNYGYHYPYVESAY